MSKVTPAYTIERLDALEVIYDRFLFFEDYLLDQSRLSHSEGESGVVISKVAFHGMHNMLVETNENLRAEIDQATRLFCGLKGEEKCRA